MFLYTDRAGAEAGEAGDTTGGIPGSSPVFITFPFDPAEDHERYGFGTFRTRFRLLHAGENRVYLHIPEFPSAWRLWVNGRLRGESGVVGSDISSTVPQYRIDYFELGGDTDEYEVVLEFANFHNHRSRIAHPPVITSRDRFQHRFISRNLIHILIDGAFLFLFVYYLILYLLDRRNTEHLFFALFVFSLLFRQLLLGQEVSSAALYRIPWHIKYGAWQVMIPVQLLAYDGYLRAAFPDDTSRTVSRFLAVFTGAYAVFCFVVPAPIMTASIIVPQMVALFFGSYVLFMITIAIARKRDRAWLLALSSAVLFMAVINDILFSAGLVSTGRVLNFGALVFVLFQAAFLAQRYAAGIHRAELLTGRLHALSGIYRRFLPDELPAALGKAGGHEIGPGDFTTSKMCVLVLDVQGFTAISETLNPTENFDFINDFLDRTAPVIRASRGFITGFAGDQIEALFRTAPDGVDAAIRIQRSLAEYNSRIRPDSRPDISVGIGLSYGEVIVTAVGSESRLQMDVISRAVRRAIRLEGITRKTDSLILCDDEVIRRCEETVRLSARMLGTLAFSADSTTPIYELIYSFMERRHIRKLETKYLFERGVRFLMEGDQVRGRENLLKVVQENPDDFPARFHLDSLEVEGFTGAALDAMYDP